jgi:glycerol-3-phosphate acyltransferase PlsX
VKSHGGADVSGVANAIDVAAKLVSNDITRRITEDLDKFRARSGSAPVAA